MFKFLMFEIVRDRVSGYQGVILARIEYSTGCRHYGIAPQEVNKDKKLSEWEYLDESRLISTGRFLDISDTKPEQVGGTSGPCENPPQW